MSDVERFNRTLQENLITVLAFDKDQGRIVANSLDPNLMEGDFRLIAERCIDYWREFKKPPTDHTADLVADILEDKHNRRATPIRRILQNMMLLSESINTQYVMNQLRDFSRMQRIKAAIIESADKINNRQHVAIHDIEEIWNGILRTQERDFNPGMRLYEVERVLERLRFKQSEFDWGIDELDSRGIVPTRGTILILIAAAGRGKTWGLVHLGKRALMARKKVLHITLEMDEEDIGQRYYQSLFAVAKNEAAAIDITTLNDDMGKLESLEREVHKTTWGMNSEMVKEELFNHMDHLGRTRIMNLIIKRFPPAQLTPNGLRAFLDTLEITEGFIPDMLIFDYLRLAKVDTKNLRQSMGDNVVEFRGIAVERNLAFVTAHQASKAGEDAPMIKATHGSEDWSIIGTADWVITYSCTPTEFRFGLGRLFVAKARSEEDRFVVLLTQSYKMGQFALESHYLSPKYFEFLKGLAKTDDEDDDDTTDDDDDEK